MAAELAALAIGLQVKICNNKERIRVVVKRIEGAPSGSAFASTITAEVNNHLVCGSEYNLGDEVVFEGRHIYAVMSAPVGAHSVARELRVKDVIP